MPLPSTTATTSSETTTCSNVLSPKKQRISRATKAKELMNKVISVSQLNQKFSTTTQHNLSMTRLILGSESIEVPQIMLENEDLFRNVLSKSVYYSLSETNRNFLRRLLPIKSNADNQSDEDAVLDCVFTTDQNFNFGNPISKMFWRIKSGQFSGQQIADEVHLRTYHRAFYDHYIRNYYLNLLNKILISRQIIMEQFVNVDFNDPIIIKPSKYYSMKKLKRFKALNERAKLRAHRMIQSCKEKAGCFDKSSDEEEDFKIPPIVPLAPGAESTLYSKQFCDCDYDMHQPMRLKDTKELLREYRNLCEIEPDCPSCDISDICLEEVYERAGVSFQSEKNFATNFFEKQKDNANRSACSTPLNIINYDYN